MTEETTETAVAEDEISPLQIEVTIKDIGPCKKHISVVIPEKEVTRYEEKELAEIIDKAEIPGFRVGHVPKQLVKKRFKNELEEQIKRQLLLDSLDRISDDHDLDPIGEPNLDLEGIDFPESGDLEYEFDIEVRPDFEIPDFKSFTLDRDVHDVSEEEIDDHMSRYLSQYGELVDKEGGAEPEDYITAAVEFTQDDRTLNKSSSEVMQVKSVLRFEDTELKDFDKLMAGAKVDDVKETEVVISSEAESLEMRGETIKVKFSIKEVRRLDIPEFDGDFMERINVESEEALRDSLADTLVRQQDYRQRQSARKQIREKMIEASDWDLPEDLVLRQVDNSLRRETLEMQQAGFSKQEILSRQNEMRQDAISSTRDALKEHFILDKVADEQKIEISEQDLETEIMMMAYQRGENPRRMRAQLVKNGMMENLDAQLKERHAIDFILDQVQYKDLESKPFTEGSVEAIALSACGFKEGVTVVEEDEDDEVDNSDDE